MNHSRTSPSEDHSSHQSLHSEARRLPLGSSRRSRSTGSDRQLVRPQPHRGDCPDAVPAEPPNEACSPRRLRSRQAVLTQVARMRRAATPPAASLWTTVGANCDLERRREANNNLAASRLPVALLPINSASGCNLRRVGPPLWFTLPHPLLSQPSHVSRTGVTPDGAPLSLWVKALLCLRWPSGQAGMTEPNDLAAHPETTRKAQDANSATAARLGDPVGCSLLRCVRCD